MCLFCSESTILLVAHGASLETCSRQLVGGQPRTQHQFYMILHRTPYLGCAALEESPSASETAAPADAAAAATPLWRISEPPIFPFQHQANESYNWRVLNTELG